MSSSIQIINQGATHSDLAWAALLYSRIMIMFFLSINLSGCVCFDIYEQWIDRTSLGDDIVSINLKDTNLDTKHQRAVELTNNFFSGYTEKNEIVKYFNKIGGECWDIEGEYIGACRVTRESPWYARKTICSRPKLQGIKKDVLIYKFKKIDDRFYFDYEWDVKNSSSAQSIKW